MADEPDLTGESDERDRQPEEPATLAEPIILESAHRHGVAEDDTLHALRFAIGHVRQADDMVMFIGPTGREHLSRSES